MSDWKCSICRWWVPRSRLRNQEAISDGFGECRKNAPVGTSVSVFSLDETPEEKRANKVVYIAYPFPPTDENDFCGEFQP